MFKYSEKLKKKFRLADVINAFVSYLWVEVLKFFILSMAIFLFYN